MSTQEQILDEIAQLLKSPKDLVKAISQLIEQNTTLQKSLSAYQNKEVGDLKNTLKSQIQNKDGVYYIIQQVEIPTADALKNLAFELQSESPSLFCLLVAEIDGKASLALAISKELTEKIMECWYDHPRTSQRSSRRRRWPSVPCHSWWTKSKWNSSCFKIGIKLFINMNSAIPWMSFEQICSTMDEMGNSQKPFVFLWIIKLNLAGLECLKKPKYWE